MDAPRRPKIAETIIDPTVRLREAEIGRRCEILANARVEYSSLGDYSYLGEYCEVAGHGIAVGTGKYEEEFSVGNIGAVIEAREGEDVRLSHTVDTTDAGWSRTHWMTRCAAERGP